MADHKYPEHDKLRAVNVRVRVSAITPKTGISSRYVDMDMHVGTIDWTPSMLLDDSEVGAIIEAYRQQGATEMRVTFEIPL